MKLPLHIPPRVAFAFYVILAAAAFVAHSTRATRLTMVNVGILIEHAPQAALVLLGLGLALLAIAAVTSTLLPRLLGLALALCVTWFGANDLLFRITTDRDALRLRGLVQRTALTWKEVAKVENEGAQVVLVALGGRQVRLDLGRLTEQQRAAFHRTIARRIWEAGPGPAR